MFKDNFELLPGTGFKALVTAAPAAYAGFEAIRSGIKYGEKVEQIETLLNNRQSIDNPYKDIENPYKNLPVATQAARMQAEQADISLANTLDTLRATGAAAGGATALAQAALKSKQSVAASIEKQEATNARLQAQGQFKTDMAKAQGESFRMRMQEARDVRDVNRMQGDADILKATQIANKRAVFNQLGQAGQALVGGIVPTQISEEEQIQSGLSSDPGITSGTSSSISPTINNQTGAQVTGLDPSQSQLNTITQDQQDISDLANAGVTSSQLQNITIDPNLPTNTVMEPLNLGQQLNLSPVIGQQAQSIYGGVMKPVSAINPTNTLQNATELDGYPGVDPILFNDPVEIHRLLYRKRLDSQGILYPK